MSVRALDLSDSGANVDFDCIRDAGVLLGAAHAVAVEHYFYCPPVLSGYGLEIVAEFALFDDAVATVECAGAGSSHRLLHQLLLESAAVSCNENKLWLDEQICSNGVAGVTSTWSQHIFQNHLK